MTTRPMRMEAHFGRVMHCYAERPSNVDRMFRDAVAFAPDAEAVIDGDTRLSYRQLEERASRMAAGLRAGGIGKDDRVALMLSNRLEAIVSLFAVARIGAVIVLIGTRLKRPEVEYIVTDSQAKALIYDGDYANELPAPHHVPAVAMRFRVGSPSFDAFFENGAVTEESTTHEDDLFGILYTSGTTGKPKGAMLTHLGAVHSALHWTECLKLERDERTILCIPWSHVAGLCGVVLPFLRDGARLILMREFKRRAFLELAAQERITHALLVPAMYGLCLLEPDLAQFDFSSWRLGVYGSAPMPEATIRRFAEAVPRLTMCNAYGATETTSPATIMPPGDGVAHSESIGKVVPCGDIRVMDDEGRELPPGETGELWIAGPMIVPGYWRNDAATEASFVGGYWKSGDVGAVDTEGYVRIADRKKDMINRGGYKVYPAEVENVLAEIEHVVESAVVGRPDDVLGERVVAFINAPAGKLTSERVREFCASRLADYKVPEYIVIADRPLPRNANGKIQKADLRRTMANDDATVR
ncbi:MAG TPA: class I adenylate-forming enzyme family protein [Casimicrobiaceae bacterium]|nr:class I adenylate-forming enzyme family protein [Casimicrobiaceae bacterium]